MDDDFDMGRFGMFDSLSTSGRSAYILVYEKKKKTDLMFEFSQEQIHLKEKLIQDLVADEDKERVVVSEVEDKTQVRIPYYGLKPFIPQELDSEINEDNFKFLIEQQVYSKEFLGFITKISNFPQLPEFDPLLLPNRIYKNQIPQKFKDLLMKVLKMQMNLFHTILSKSEENDVKSTKSVCRQVHRKHDEDNILVSRALQRDPSV